MKYKMIFTYPNGEEEECDKLFDSYEAADWEAHIWAEGVSTGFDILSLSNPGDYDDMDDEGCSWEVIEVEE